MPVPVGSVMITVDEEVKKRLSERERVREASRPRLAR